MTAAERAPRLASDLIADAFAAKNQRVADLEVAWSGALELLAERTKERDDARAREAEFRAWLEGAKM